MTVVSTDRHVRNTEFLLIDNRNTKWYNYSAEQLSCFSYTSIYLLFNQQFHYYLPNNNKSLCLCQNLSIQVFTKLLFVTAPNWINYSVYQPVCRFTYCETAIKQNNTNKEEWDTRKQKKMGESQTRLSRRQTQNKI